jgi:protein dithiol oxidoreductase (disulfide-forming)
VKARRRQLLIAAAAGLVLARLSAFAGEARLREGVEYRDIAPQPVPPGPKVEVVEFFWYGCPHCNLLQPFLEQWLKKKPADVEFRRVPAIFRQSWVPHARLFYTLETLGELERLHQAVYRAIHTENRSLNSADSATDWAVQNGIDKAKFIAAYDAPEVAKKVEQAIAQTRSYRIEGTPSVVVDGRYVTSSSMSDTYAGVIVIVDDLVRLARERRPKA